MIDIASLAGIPTNSDFNFQTGNTTTPASWPPAPAPLSITVRRGAGAAGSDRITILWADNAIQGQWLQVTVLATATTALGSPDIFCFGNAIGDCGNSVTDAKVNATDEVLTRNNPRATGFAPVDFRYDYNRDSKVNATDEIIARNHATSSLTALQVSTLPFPNSVLQWAQWARFEVAVVNTRAYADPYRDVTLNVTYRRPDASSVNFWGFYDGSNTWRIRFMPDQTGAWSYSASFSDGAPGASGSFQCVSGDIAGMISRDEGNPLWFGFKGGRHVLIRSFHVGDRFFAANWPAASRTAFLDWAQSQGYNMLSIASHYLNRAVADRGLGWDTPDLWDGPSRGLKAGEYQKMERVLDDLAARKMLVFPFAGFFGKSSDFPTNPADQELYLRYTLARIGSYWNVVFAVAGPEALYAYDAGQYQNAMGINDISRLGSLIQSLDVFGHLLSVHNVTGENAFKNQPWESYTTLQGPKTVNRQDLSSGLLAFHGAKPLYAQEVL